MIITFYGEGKGKTSAALGVALRSIGWNRRVKIFQFIKSNQWVSGEIKPLKKLGVEVDRGGIGFVGIHGDKFEFEAHRDHATELLKKVHQDVISSRYDVLILDEILIAIKLKLVKLNDVIELIKIINQKSDLILTGRPKIKKIIELSNMVSRIDKVKHPFDHKITAKKGIDY